MAYFGDRIDRTVEKGERVCDGWLSLGDHLFVNRVGIYLLGPARGDVTVFCTEGIEYKPQPLGGYYYIKRLAGMPGDTLKIEKGVLLVKPKGAKEFKPVYEICEKFKKVYSMKGGYQGHSIPAVPEEYRAYMTLSKEGQEVVVPDDCYFMLGDNTTSSLDSRYWGFVPRRNLVGTAGFVFWPFSRRWGLADFRAPIDEPTALPHSMCLQ
jgi:signal peptidase I